MPGERVINITNWFYVIIPLMALGALIGFRRGWKIEAITAMGIFFTGLALAEAGAQFLRLVNKLPKLIYFLIGEEIPDLPPLISGDGNIALFFLGVFAIAIILFYVLPSILIKRPVGIPGAKGANSTWSERFVGALIGGITGFMIFNVGLQWFAAYIKAYPNPEKLEIQLRTTIILPPINELLDPAKWLLIAKPLTLIAVLGSVFLAILYFTILKPRANKGSSSGGDKKSPTSADINISVRTK